MIEDERHLAQDLCFLAIDCERWLAAWGELPERLERTRRVALLKAQEPEEGVCRRAEAVIAALAQFFGASAAPTPSFIHALAATVEQLEAAERKEAGWDQEGSLYAGLHQMKNLTIVLATERILSTVDRSLKAVRREEVRPGELVTTLERLCGALQNGDVRAVRSALPVLQRSAEMLWELRPRERARLGPPPETASRSWLIVAVEDMPEWRMTIRSVVDLARRRLPAFFELRYEEYADRDAAQAMLAEAQSKVARGGPRVLLVLDLGLPRKSGRDAGHEAGRELLAFSREKLNVPVIVLTTPHNFLDDHLLAHRLGVSDYLLKGAESDRALLEALLRVVGARAVRTLAVSEDGSRTVRIDDVELRLDPLPFAVLAIVARHRRGDCGLPVTVPTIRRDLVQFDLDCRDVEDTVYKIRTSVAEGLRAAGHTIVPAEEVLASTRLGDEFAYRVVARIVDPEQPGGGPREARRVLVVEDMVELWQRPVVELLGRYGYEVAAAASRAEAVELARTFEPHLLVLDMCLPNAPGAPLDPGAGLRAFAEIQEILPDTRAVVLTDLGDDDFLRSTASELGIRPEDVVRKGTSLKATAVELVLKLWRAELEIQRQARLPLPDLPSLPYLRLRGHPSGEPGLAAVTVFEKEWRPTRNEALLLYLLSRRPGRSVRTEDIYDVLWPVDETPDDLDPANALKNLVKRFRQRIAREWLGVQDNAHSRRIAREVLANDGKDSYILNARVDWEEEPELEQPVGSSAVSTISPVEGG